MTEKVTFLLPPRVGEAKLLEDSVNLVFQQARGQPVHHDATLEVFRRLQEVRRETPPG